MVFFESLAELIYKTADSCRLSLSGVNGFDHIVNALIKIIVNDYVIVFSDTDGFFACS